MAGSPKSLTINGVRFRIPADATPKVIKGGRQFVDSESYGDGTTEPIEAFVAGRITDMVVSTSDGAYDSLMSFRGKKSLSIVYESATKSYELTGYIVKSEGIENDTSKDKSSEFELRAQSGEIRES